jgi:hypothetical protein
MKATNVIEMIKKQLAENPALQEAYSKEKKKYAAACRMRETRERAKAAQN